MRPVQLVFTDIGLHRRPFGRARTGATATVAVLLAITLLAAGCMAWQCWQTQRELTGARDVLDTLRREKTQGAAQAEPATRVRVPQQREAWAQIAGQLNTPWRALLDALETVTPENVALVSIEPDARQASVRLEVEARELDTLLRYATGMNGVGLFEEVMLIRHAVNEQDRNRPLRLNLDVRLKSRGPQAALVADGGWR